MEVGRYSITLEDKSRYEVLGYSSANRFVETVIYYPVEDSAVEGKSRAKYVYDHKLVQMHPFYKKMLAKYENVINLYEDVEASEGKFPVIFFSHGYGGYAEQNQRMIIDLVKTGFIVVSLGHAFEAAVIGMENHGVILQDKKIKTVSPMIPALIAQYKLLNSKTNLRDSLDNWNAFQNKYCSFMKSRVQVWADDTTFVLKYLKEQNSNEKFLLYDRMDFSRGVGATGHSFGGCTAYYLCMNNPEFTCGINIDGGVFGDYEGLNAKPFMQISCEKNVNLATRTICFRKAEVYRIIFKKMKHIGFSDSKYYAGNKSFVGKLNTEKMELALFSAHREFFSKYLKGIDSNFKVLEEAACDEIVFERYED